MSNYRRLGRQRKRVLRALRLANEPALREQRAAFLAARRERRATGNGDAA
jgi:hypothetical protein